MTYLKTLATRRPLGAQTQPRMQAHDVICVHTMVGYLSSTDSYFDHANGEAYKGTESHFGIGGIWGSDKALGLDGVAWQWQDLAFTADANYRGNPTVLSIETADNAPRSASQIVRWTPKQAEKLVDLIATLCRKETHAMCPSTWTCHREGIPARLIPDTRPGRRGLGYHGQGVPGNGLVAGGVPWSLYAGKECPGPVRIQQYRNEIIPAVQRKLAGPRTPPTQPAVAPDNESEEQPMIVIRQEKGLWYILLGGKLVPLYAGMNIPAALPRLRVTERQWARFVAAGVVAKVA